MSGYDLKQLIPWSVGNFWREGYGQIYPALRELEKQKLVVKQTQRQKGKPDRNEYSLTAAGRKRLAAWLAVAPQPDVPRNELLLKLFFGSRAPLAVSLVHLEERRRACEQEIAGLSAIGKRIEAEHGKHPDRPFWEITLSCGDHMARAELAWCEESLKKLKKLERR